jgi:uncharacterized protein
MPQLAEMLARPRSGWAGWLFCFGKRAATPYSEQIGWRVLVACLALEGIARPYVRNELRSLGFGAARTGPLAIACCMLVLALGLTAIFVRLPFSRIGLYGWRQWTLSEKLFLPQIIAVSLVAFTLAQWSELASLPNDADWIRGTMVVFIGQMLWGFYQEYVYRGLLQTELVRRWGAVTGIVSSNLIFTFGPLHSYHFAHAIEHPNHLFIFAAIFAIGLYFGILFQRSGNLWIIAVVHGIGDFFIDGLAGMR